MATHASDSLDEFFDFARLEHDHGLRPSSGPCHHQSEPVNLPDDVMVMDWATEEMTPICPADAFSTNDVHMQVPYEEIPTGQSAQSWPLVDAPNQSLSTVTPTAMSTWDMCTATAEQHPMQSQEPHSFAPLSSDPAREHIELIDEDDEEGSKGALGLPQEPTSTELAPSDLLSNSPSALETPVNHSRHRPPAPLRQASTASWKPASAKRKGPQSRIPLEARQILEDEFAANPYPCSWEMDIIAHQANLDVKKVRNWFNNTRARKKGEGMFLLLTTIHASRSHIQTLNLLFKRCLTTLLTH